MYSTYAETPYPATLWIGPVIMCAAVGRPLLPFPIATDPDSAQPPVPVSCSPHVIGRRVNSSQVLFGSSIPMLKKPNNCHFAQGQGDIAMTLIKLGSLCVRTYSMLS